MPRLKLTLLAAAALICTALALVLTVRVGSGAWPVITLFALFALLALTCILRIITLRR